MSIQFPVTFILNRIEKMRQNEKNAIDVFLSFIMSKNGRGFFKNIYQHYDLKWYTQINISGDETKIS